MSDTIALERPNGSVTIPAADYFQNLADKTLKAPIATYLPQATAVIFQALHNPARPNDGGCFRLAEAHASPIEQLVTFVYEATDEASLQRVFGLGNTLIDYRPSHPARQEQFVVYMRKRIISSAATHLHKTGELELIGVGNDVLWQATARATEKYLHGTHLKEPCRRRR